MHFIAKEMSAAALRLFMCKYLTSSLMSLSGKLCFAKGAMTSGFEKFMLINVRLV